MIAYILILCVVAGTTSKALTTAEFTTYDKCVRAGEKAKKEFNGFTTSTYYVCTEK